MDEWIELFARRGFFRDAAVDASFVAPHAVLLGRTPRTAVDVATSYERWHWSDRHELQNALERAKADTADEVRRRHDEERRWLDDKRRWRDEEQRLREEADLVRAELAEWNLFRSRSGYRIFLRLANLRLQLCSPWDDARPGRTARSCAESRTGSTSAARITPASSARSTGLAAVLFVSSAPSSARSWPWDLAPDVDPVRDSAQERTDDPGRASSHGEQAEGPPVGGRCDSRCGCGTGSTRRAPPARGRPLRAAAAPRRASAACRHRVVAAAHLVCRVGLRTFECVLELVPVAQCHVRSSWRRQQPVLGVRPEQDGMRRDEGPRRLQRP